MVNIDEQLIDEAGCGNMAALAQLDARGLTPAADEDAAGFAARLRTLKGNMTAMESALRQDGTYTVEGVTVEEACRIPPEGFEKAQRHTDRLYGFSCDWVPGFYLNPRFSGLFGGCAFYFYPEFFALFIIRHSFRDRERWLCYNRDELLAHELCHVARVGLFSRRYEELFAYQTAATAFRRFTGGIFRSQGDVFLFLGAAFFQVICQLVRAFVCPALPAWIGWGALGGVVFFLVMRLLLMQGTVKRARTSLVTLYHGDMRSANSALFHATDEEVEELAKSSAPAELLARYSREHLRWRIALYRFPLPE